MQIIINSSNGISRIFQAAEEGETLQSLCSHPDVIEFFEAADGDDVLDNVCALNGAEISEGLRGFIGTMTLEDGATLDFDLEAVEDEEAIDEDEDSDDDVAPSVGGDGVVTVLTSGGMQTTNVRIVNGRTTVKAAIFNDTVRARSGMTDAQLSNCVIQVNNVCVSLDTAEVQTVRNGDMISLSPRSAKTMGC